MICRRASSCFPQKAHHGFVPLPYQPENNSIAVHTPPSVARDALRTLAVSRIYVDTGRLKFLFARAHDRV